jgi:hypothetical protein
MNKYTQELVTEMLFDVSDLAFGHSFQDVGYENKKEFFLEMQSKLEQLDSLLSTKEKV